MMTILPLDHPWLPAGATCAALLSALLLLVARRSRRDASGRTARDRGRDGTGRDPR
ncbi:MAG: hypothetical protein U1F11_14165 [Steroidobacteraceae bacterium]